MSIYDETRPVWGWAMHDESESWEKAGNTRDEALAFAHANGQAADEHGPAAFGYICEGRYLSPAAAVVAAFDLDGLLDQMNELDEATCFDDPPFETRGDGQAARSAVEAALAAWADKHVLGRTRFGLTGNPEKVEAAANG